jgi:hypothetical protein
MKEERGENDLTLDSWHLTFVAAEAGRFATGSLRVRLFRSLDAFQLAGCVGPIWLSRSNIDCVGPVNVKCQMSKVQCQIVLLRFPQPQLLLSPINF